jgi:hypothetical protein
MKKLYTAAHLMEAHTLQAMLQSYGISVFVKGEALVGALGELPASVAQLELWIDEVQWELAQQLLNDFRDADKSGVHWCCSLCGEENPPEFELCWQCQQEISP